MTTIPTAHRIVDCGALRASVGAARDVSGLPIGPASGPGSDERAGLDP